MLYLLAILFSLIVSLQSFAVGATAGNIRHLKNGRLPNAGASVIPTIPMVPLLAIGVVWLLRTFIPEYAFGLLVGLFLILSILLALSFRKLKAELDRIK